MKSPTAFSDPQADEFLEKMNRLIEIVLERYTTGAGYALFLFPNGNEERITYASNREREFVRERLIAFVEHAPESE